MYFKENKEILVILAQAYLINNKTLTNNINIV